MHTGQTLHVQHHQSISKNIAAIWGWVIITALIIAGAEALSYAALYIGKQTALSALIYEPPIPPSREEYADYLAKRNPVTGWPSNKYETPNDLYVRPVENFSESDAPCISAYGDSFIFGSEVSNEETWSNYLADKLDCRPANYGVPGFGLGQALLRYRGNLQDQAPVTFLGIYPFDYARTINQYRPFVGGGDNGWKPRYHLENGVLQLTPLPLIEFKELASFYAQPEDFLKYESFLPGSALGPVHFSFPYTEKIIQLALKEETLNGLRGIPRWSNMIQPGHASQAFEITMAIAADFMKQCEQREKQCFVVLLPTNTAYNHFVSSQERISQALLDEFERQKIPLLDLMPQFQAALGDDEFCTTLNRPDICEGHFSPMGNRMFANFLNDYLREKQLIR